MFGAAIPYQGGMGHINENWIEFWSNSFRKHNYICYDLFRDKFWHDNSVIYYYRQNTMLYVKEGTDSALIKMGYKADLNPKTYIHPDMYIKALNRPLPPQEKQVYTDVNIYYDQAKNGGNKVQEEKKNIYGDKHLGWKHQINRFKKYS